MLTVVSQEIETLADEVFKVDPKIQHLGLIDLEGHIMLDQSTGSKEPNKPNTDRIMFYYQVGLRRSRREHFNDAYGETTYIHIVRKKMQQMILYLPMLTIYLTIDQSSTPKDVVQISERISNMDKTIVEKAVTSKY